MSMGPEIGKELQVSSKSELMFNVFIDGRKSLTQN